ncbi:hypothetical protein SCHPADRAFT_891398 [Schizopora paradoxa]|uniref:NTF2-like protein n=1 Tax=Schizopora paradoxa TaxID=27342 RepID=A0A0H2RI47_9AGAM|nr:hypothetical protein SCHPADRAFT_891398 [Schizopora paradoxa]
MTSDIVLPPTPTWAQERITAIYQAKSGDDFTNAFDAFVSKNVQSIVFNGQTLTRDQYKSQISGEKFLETSATVTFSGTVDSPVSGASSPQDFVGLSFKASVVESIRVHDAAQEHTVQSTIIIEVQSDPSIPVPKPPIRGDVDTRRVFKLTQVLVDQPGAGTSSS